MSARFEGTLFDGETLRPHAVIMEAHEMRLKCVTEGVFVDVAIAELRTSDRLASLPRFLYLPDNRTIETKHNDLIDDLLAGQNRGRTVAAVYWLEARAPIAAAASFLLVALVSVTLWWGLPVLARKAAMAVPDEMEKRAGQTALQTINQILGQSQLKLAEKKRAEAQIERLVKAGNIDHKPELIFRSMGGASPNAFALPGGFIVVSDELINLSVTNEELAAVLAHEMGHWQRRHGIQSILRSSTALLLVSTVTGDLSTLTTFAGSIPFIILQRGYSREFEAEADTYAVDLLLRANIDVANFGSVLEKLEKARPESGQDFTYLSTHPSNAERIRRINPTGRRPTVVEKEPDGALENTAPTLPSFHIPDGTDSGTRDIPPRAFLQTNPTYPTELSVQRITGQVTVEFIVDARGNTTDFVVVRSTDRRFEAAALAAVAQWKYSPGRRNGKAIPVRVSITIEFNLDEPTAPTEKPAQRSPGENSSSDVPPVIPLEP